MKLETLNDRIQKAEERIMKKQNTIEKKTKMIEKKQSSLSKLDGNDKYWAECDIEGLTDDINRLHKEIEEIQQTLEGYKGQLAGAKAKVEIMQELPEALKQMQNELVTRWDEYDKKHRDFLKKQYSELGYTEFVKKYRYSAYDDKDKTDEQIHAGNMKDAEDLILNLVNRVRGIVGEITDWSNVRATAGTYGFTVLNGYVVGTQGRCVVESIGAGGYNIQRYHIRVLVHEIN
jgi:chromosome segregation ATPase